MSNKKIQIKQIYTKSSEIGCIASQITAATVTRYDSKIFGMVDILEMGFAKTEVVVEFEDGEKVEFNCGFSLSSRDGLESAIRYSSSIRRFSHLKALRGDRYARLRMVEAEAFEEKYDWGLA